MELNGLLYSQIGYDLKDPMRALIRSNSSDFIKEGTMYEVIDIRTGKVAAYGEVNLWGEKWKSTWWEIDFSQMCQPGEYRLDIKYQGQIVMAGQTFKVGNFLLWEETIKSVAIEQFEERARLAPHGKVGWKDCGANMKEINSHAAAVIGLCDALGLGFYNYLNEEDEKRVIAQIINGCDYICLCQDKAERLGYPKGAIIHEIPNHMIIIPGDIMQCVVALTYSSRLLSARKPEKSDEYLERAVNAYEYLVNHAKPFGADGFSHSNHGAPPDFIVPKEWMTRDLLMMMWGGLELWISGKTSYKENVISLARLVMDRQVPESAKEGELYGHFYTFSDCGFTEKANTHHHVGHDTGSIFPHYILPFLTMISRWYDHPDMPIWKETVKKFAYGYLLPACSQNPFYLLPEGYFAGQGLLNFCGPWHGINASICYGAVVAARLEDFTNDMQFRKIAVGNIQWIAGLNSGITKECMKGCVIWREDIPEGVAEPRSLIYGIGKKSAGCWTGIKGTITNGFSANPQFQLVVPATLENDGPWHYTDEDWIPHAAGWISALSHLREIKFYRDVDWDCEKFK